MKLSRTAEFIRRIDQPDPAVVAQLDNLDETTTRILDAVLEQAELVGLRRCTMDDVARRSGVGRATVYRRFPTKTALIDALVLAEARRFLEGSALARSRATTLEDHMVNGSLFTVSFLREHRLLLQLMRTEPETILTSLTVDAGAIIDYATDYTVGWLRPEVYGTNKTTPAQERHLRTVAELQTRLTLSFIVTPHTGIDFSTDDDMRAYVRRYLLPMITKGG